MAIEHTRTRARGGRLLTERGNVRVRLGHRYAQLEVDRSLIWRAADAVERDPNSTPHRPN
jgi:alkylation response protein AidB-like acyl-CoA dehydrogenase